RLRRQLRLRRLSGNPGRGSPAPPRNRVAAYARRRIFAQGSSSAPRWRRSRLLGRHGGRGSASSMSQGLWAQAAFEVPKHSKETANRGNQQASFAELRRDRIPLNVSLAGEPCPSSGSQLQVSLRCPGSDYGTLVLSCDRGRLTRRLDCLVIAGSVNRTAMARE